MGLEHLITADILKVIETTRVMIPPPKTGTIFKKFPLANSLGPLDACDILQGYDDREMLNSKYTVNKQLTKLTNEEISTDQSLTHIL